MNATAAQTKSLEWLNRLRANPKIPLIVAGSAAVAVMVALILWAKAPDYRTLFSNLSDQDGGAIVSQLTQMNIPYRFSEASGAIEVPADKVHELRLRLAQQGLPKGGAVGFELLDQESLVSAVQRTGELSAGAGRRAFSYHRNYRPVKGGAYIWQCQNRLYSSVNKNPFCISDGKSVTRPRTR